MKQNLLSLINLSFLFQKMFDVENDILINLADNFNTSKTLNLLIELINTFNKLLTVVMFNILILFKLI